MRQIGLTHGASDLAIPPIRPDEAKLAEIALCPAHGSRFEHLNRPGTVMFCPLGGMYWRANQGGHGMHARLSWPRGM